VSGSSNDQSESEVEDIPEVVTSPVVAKNSLTRVPKNSTSCSLTQNSTRESTPVNTNSVNRTNIIGGQTRQLTNQDTDSLNINKIQRSKTPGISESDQLTKDALTSRYKINTQDREVIVRKRLSKTPDRELYSNRRNSFAAAASKRLSKSCDSLDSNDSENKDTNVGTDPKRKSKLKEHRRRGKRAATVHTLDSDQLLLILNLQMRYLQESKVLYCIFLLFGIIVKKLF